MNQTPLSPDSNLRAPKRRLPSGTIDCHAHIFDLFDQYPLDSDRKYTPPVCTREEWLRVHAALGVDRGVQVHGSAYGFDNSITEDFIQTDPDRFRAVAAISPHDSVEHLKRLHAAGFRAARLMDQFPTGATTKDLEAIARLCAEVGWHIEINVKDAADWISLEQRLMQSPVGLVIDHMGRVRGGQTIQSEQFSAVRRLLARKPNTWVKISSWYRVSDAAPPEYSDMKPFAQTLLTEFPDQCVWGTNWPHPGIHQNMPNDIDLADLLETWIPNEEVRTKLFVTNPEKLYDFSPFKGRA
ncbi:MAG: amidohydrolase family protein [Burkholderiales bacterium]|jgi:2-pyrone-4,6-dicarboxylate lactonase|nr:amidohydrolase family protein [Burkholderiales bacterium]MDP4969878.1 amidohydrolase family protein [Burkholderiaceae bacterium]MDP5112120.1 amidohydrolase family protein [Burkholderiaceae bacterium]